MTTSREDFEALMPEPDIRINVFGEILPTGGRRFVMAGGYYTADQMRAMFEAATERAAKVCEAECEECGGVVAGPFATEFGKQIHQAMAAGARNCAAAIRGTE